jgi:hypothetical protein
LADAAELTTAFALAGLGGFNAHGAGFLEAASKCGVVPDLVTATSGQIVVLADWLQHKNLEESLVSPELEHNAMAQLAVLLNGEQGVFRPAYREALERWWIPPTSIKDWFNRLLPAQVYVPTRDATDFATIAGVFNDCRDIGIAFEELRRCSVEVSRASRSPRNVVDFHLEPFLVKASAKVIDLCQWNPRPARMPYIVGSLASRDKYHIYLL